MALWRVEQAAEYLGIRPKTLYEWVRQGRVPYRKIGFNVRFDPAELEEWTANQSKGSDPGEPAVAVPDRGNRSGLGSLAVEASAVLRDLEKDVGASLSFPQRRKLIDLADRLDEAATGSES